ncbi:unnamed protein product [Effrenium voratum]|nr:unnamed protein product [Effrenium voratum]
MRIQWLLLFPAAEGELRLNAQLMRNLTKASKANESLWKYFFPESPTSDVMRNWVPYTPQCAIDEQCWCFHVEGSMSKAVNPRGAERGFINGEPENLTGTFRANQDCACLAPSTSGCLFGDMRPAKLLAAVALLRFLNVTQVIEDGRYGGLSALVYALHGFEVTSVEMLPLGHVKETLGAFGVRLHDGDSREALPQILKEMHPWRRAAVIFDGLKRFEAYEVYKKIAPRVAVAIFDDTNIRDGLAFRRMLAQHGHQMWSSDAASFGWVLKAEEPYLEQLLLPLRGRRFQGGIQKLQDFHYTILEGGAWPRDSKSRAGHQKNVLESVAQNLASEAIQIRK